MNKKSLFFLGLFLCASHSSPAFQVGLVLDRGGKNDRSFNSAAFEGTERAKKELGIEFKHIETQDSASVEAAHRNFAKKKFDLVIGVGFAQAEAVKKVSKAFPDIKFAIVDAPVDAPNVTSLLFEEHEGSFLVGALAALQSKKSIGFLGGMDIPLIRRFYLGYEAGAKHINPKIEISKNYVGITGEAWNNPAKAKELALLQFNKGVEVIFAAAGASGLGVFDAAEEKKKFAIGVDSNQNWIKPGWILTSMLKRVDLAVYETIKSTKSGNFKPGHQRFGLSDRGIDYAIDEHNQALIKPEMKNRLEQLRKEILEKKIKVPDYYLLGK